jgi:hypothetical protein
MTRPTIVFANVSVPEPLGEKLDSAPPSATHLSPAFVGLAIVALAVVAYLVWDIYRQKREERRQRQRIERFRERKFKQAQEPPA